MTDRVVHMDPTKEASFGFPSGHTLTVVALFGYVATCVRSGWLTAAYVAMVVLTCVSRLYLGAHFVVDVRAGSTPGRLTRVRNVSDLGTTHSPPRVAGAAVRARGCGCFAGVCSYTRWLVASCWAW